MDGIALLTRASEEKVAFVPNAPFYAGDAQHNAPRLSFVTVPDEKIRYGVLVLGRLIKAAIANAAAR